MPTNYFTWYTYWLCQYLRFSINRSLSVIFSHYFFLNRLESVGLPHCLHGYSFTLRRLNIARSLFPYFAVFWYIRKNKATLTIRENEFTPCKAKIASAKINLLASQKLIYSSGCIFILWSFQWSFLSAVALFLRCTR